MVTAWKGKCKQKRIPQPLYHPIKNLFSISTLTIEAFNLATGSA